MEGGKRGTAGRSVRSTVLEGGRRGEKRGERDGRRDGIIDQLVRVAILKEKGKGRPAGRCGRPVDHPSSREKGKGERGTAGWFAHLP